MGQLGAVTLAGSDFLPVYVLKMPRLSSKVDISQSDPAKLCSMKTAARNAPANATEQHLKPEL